MATVDTLGIAIELAKLGGSTSLPPYLSRDAAIASLAALDIPELEPHRNCEDGGDPRGDDLVTRLADLAAQPVSQMSAAAAAVQQSLQAGVTKVLLGRLASGSNHDEVTVATLSALREIGGPAAAAGGDAFITRVIALFPALAIQDCSSAGWTVGGGKLVSMATELLMGCHKACFGGAALVDLELLLREPTVLVGKGLPSANLPLQLRCEPLLQVAALQLMTTHYAADIGARQIKSEAPQGGGAVATSVPGNDTDGDALGAVLSTVQDCLSDKSLEVRKHGSYFLLAAFTEATTYAKVITQQLVNWLRSDDDTEVKHALTVMVVLTFGRSTVIDLLLDNLESGTARLREFAVVCLHYFISNHRFPENMTGAFSKLDGSIKVYIAQVFADLLLNLGAVPTVARFTSPGEPEEARIAGFKALQLMQSVDPRAVCSAVLALESESTALLDAAGGYLVFVGLATASDDRVPAVAAIRTTLAERDSRTAVIQAILLEHMIRLGGIVATPDAASVVDGVVTSLLHSPAAPAEPPGAGNPGGNGKSVPNLAIQALGSFIGSTEGSLGQGWVTKELAKRIVNDFSRREVYIRAIGKVISMAGDRLDAPPKLDDEFLRQVLLITLDDPRDEVKEATLDALASMQLHGPEVIQSARKFLHASNTSIRKAASSLMFQAGSLAAQEAREDALDDGIVDAAIWWLVHPSEADQQSTSLQGAAIALLQSVIALWLEMERFDLDNQFSTDQFDLKESLVSYLHGQVCAADKATQLAAWVFYTDYFSFDTADFTNVLEAYSVSVSPAGQPAQPAGRNDPDVMVTAVSRMVLRSVDDMTCVLNTIGNRSDFGLILFDPLLRYVQLTDASLPASWTGFTDQMRADNPIPAAVFEAALAAKAAAARQAAPSAPPAASGAPSGVTARDAAASCEHLASDAPSASESAARTSGPSSANAVPKLLFDDQGFPIDDTPDDLSLSLLQASVAEHDRKTDREYELPAGTTFVSHMSDPDGDADSSLGGEPEPHPASLVSTQTHDLTHTTTTTTATTRIPRCNLVTADENATDPADTGRTSVPSRRAGRAANGSKPGSIQSWELGRAPSGSDTESSDLDMDDTPTLGGDEERATPVRINRDMLRATKGVTLSGAVVGQGGSTADASGEKNNRPAKTVGTKRPPPTKPRPLSASPLAVASLDTPLNSNPAETQIKARVAALTRRMAGSGVGDGGAAPPASAGTGKLTAKPEAASSRQRDPAAPNVVPTAPFAPHGSPTAAKTKTEMTAPTSPRPTGIQVRPVTTSSPIASVSSVSPKGKFAAPGSYKTSVRVSRDILQASKGPTLPQPAPPTSPRKLKQQYSRTQILAKALAKRSRIPAGMGALTGARVLGSKKKSALFLSPKQEALQHLLGQEQAYVRQLEQVWNRFSAPLLALEDMAAGIGAPHPVAKQLSLLLVIIGIEKSLLEHLEPIVARGGSRNALRHIHTQFADAKAIMQSTYLRYQCGMADFKATINGYRGSHSLSNEAADLAHIVLVTSEASVCAVPKDPSLVGWMMLPVTWRLTALRNLHKLQAILGQTGEGEAEAAVAATAATLAHDYDPTVELERWRARQTEFIRLCAKKFKTSCPTLFAPARFLVQAWKFREVHTKKTGFLPKFDDSEGAATGTESDSAAGLSEPEDFAPGIKRKLSRRGAGIRFNTDKVGTETKIYLLSDCVLVAKKGKAGKPFAREFLPLDSFEVIELNALELFGVKVPGTEEGTTVCRVYKGEGAAEFIHAFKRERRASALHEKMAVQLERPPSRQGF